jgi:hypothetical protein
MCSINRRIPFLPVSSRDKNAGRYGPKTQPSAREQFPLSTTATMRVVRTILLLQLFALNSMSTTTDTAPTSLTEQREQDSETSYIEDTETPADNSNELRELVRIEHVLQAAISEEIEIISQFVL